LSFIEDDLKSSYQSLGSRRRAWSPEPFQRSRSRSNSPDTTFKSGRRFSSPDEDGGSSDDQRSPSNRNEHMHKLSHLVWGGWLLNASYAPVLSFMKIRNEFAQILACGSNELCLRFSKVIYTPSSL